MSKNTKTRNNGKMQMQRIGFDKDKFQRFLESLIEIVIQFKM